MKYPEELHVDGGTEFKSQVDKLMGEHSVKVKRVTTKYHHHFTAFVENFNKTLAELLFKIQDAQELNDPTKDSKTWVKHLYKLVTKLNNTKLDRIAMTPARAIKLDNVTLNIKAYPKEDALPVDGLYRYLYQPGNWKEATEDEPPTWFGVGMRIASIESLRTPVSVCCITLQRMHLSALSYVNNSC